MTLWLRLKNAESFYVLDLQFHKTNSAGSPQVVLSRSDIGTLAAKKISYAVGNWSTYRVSVKGNRVMVDQLSGSSWKNILDYTDTNTPISSGGLELHAAAYDATPASLQADNFKVLQTNP